MFFSKLAHIPLVTPVSETMRPLDVYGWRPVGWVHEPSVLRTAFEQFSRLRVGVAYKRGVSTKRQRGMGNMTK